MQTYISFLRGINMTGHNSIKMTELAALYENIGLKDVETYIQSGNVVFRDTAKLTVAEVSLKIETAILKKFNYNVPVLMRTTEELRKIISVNPYLDDKSFDPSKMAVIFLSELPSETGIQKVAGVNYPPDKFEIAGREIFIYCPKGFGKTKLYTNFFEKKMGVIGTARNWKTITSLLQLAEKR